MRLHGFEIAVVVKQRAAALDAECANDDIVRLADRYPHISKTPVIPGDARREIGIEKRHDVELAQSTLDARRVRFVSRALKNFHEDEVADKYWRRDHRGFEFRGRQRRQASKVSNPNGAIDKDHVRRS